MQLQDYVKQIKKGKIFYSDIPIHVLEDIDFIREMRKDGFYAIKNKGFDVVRNVFFINENQTHVEEDGKFEIKHEYSFSNFYDFYVFCDGDSLYENSCYYQCSEDRILNDIADKEIQIDVKDLLTKCYFKPFIKENLYPSKQEEYFIENFKKEIIERKKIMKKNKKALLKWLSKFINSMYSIEDFSKIYKNFKKSTCFTKTSKEFIFNNLIRADEENKFLSICYECIFNGLFSGIDCCEKAFWIKYKPEDILKYYKYNKRCVSTIQSKHKSDMRNRLNSIKGKTPHILRKYYDSSFGLYCLTYGFDDTNVLPAVFYFDTFEEYANFLKNDLSDADLRYAPIDEIDRLKFISNKKTMWPISASNLTYELEKICNETTFYVKQKLVDENDNVYIKDIKYFDYFFDFVYYVKGDLSNLQMTFCDWLENFINIEELDFTNTKIRSHIAKKFNIDIKETIYSKENLLTNVCVANNEETSLVVFNQERSLLKNDNYSELLYEQSLSSGNIKIYYISDLHLLHQMENHNCINDEDVHYLLTKIAKKLCDSDNLIICGDVVSDFVLCEKFMQFVSVFLKETNIFFVLGNHEFWSFKGDNIDYIVEKYKEMLNKYNIHLLHNNIFFYDAHYKLFELSTDYIEQKSLNEISKVLEGSRLVLLGGTGFAGYNEEFNANNGIYKNVLNRKKEIEESEKFNNIYKKMLPILKNSNSVVATHMPKKDWSGNDFFEDKIVYVNGHNHRNFFFDDGLKRIYSDNQVGYKNKIIYKKYFYINNTTDKFKHLDDGIYEISNDDYVDFYRGKNICMSFGRQINILYMLKRNDYYCFIHKNKQGGLSILNGGAFSRLDCCDINYYYNNMSKMIDIINFPLTQYLKIQNQISRIVKRIGGSGYIHGCIIDINFYNHIYVNPIDGSIHGYYALDMYDKTVYPNIPMLLEKQCPELYNNYQKLLTSNDNMNFLVPQKENS